MSQKKHLDVLCFVFPTGKGCSVHLFVKNIIDKFDNIQELPTYGGLVLVPSPPLAIFFLRVHFIYWLAMPLIIITCARLQYLNICSMFLGR